MPHHCAHRVTNQVHSQDSDSQPSSPFLLPCQPDSSPGARCPHDKHEQNGKCRPNLLKPEVGLRVQPPHYVQRAARRE